MQAKAAADAAAFRTQRESFLGLAGDPVREKLRSFEIAAAQEAWDAAAQSIEHPELQQLAALRSQLFARAAQARASLDARVASESLEIEEYKEQRKADVLGLGPEGLRLRVQISGERVERVDPWSAYLSPKLLASVLTELGPESGSEAELAALAYLIACDRLAVSLNALGSSPDAASAARLRQEVEAWQAALLYPEQLPAGALASLQQVIDLCTALEAGDDYLALNRAEDLQARFGLLSVWTTGGETDWGLEP